MAESVLKLLILALSRNELEVVYFGAVYLTNPAVFKFRHHDQRVFASNLLEVMFIFRTVAEPFAAWDCYKPEGVKPLADKFGEGGILLVFTRHRMLGCARFPIRKGPSRQVQHEGSFQKKIWEILGSQYLKGEKYLVYAKKVYYYCNCWCMLPRNSRTDKTFANLTLERS